MTKPHKIPPFKPKAAKYPGLPGKTRGLSAQEINVLVSLFGQRRYAEGEVLARQMTDKYPNDGFGWKVLGVMLMEQGRHTEAEPCHRRAIQLMPNDAETHNNLGNSLLGQEKYAEAETSYRHALRLKGDYPDAYRNLGNALLDQGRYADAEASYKQAIKLKADYAEAYNGLGNAQLKQSRYTDAEASYRRAVEIRPGYVKAYNNLGNTLLEQRRYHEAEENYRHAIESMPNYAEAHSNRGNALSKMGQAEEAIASFNTALKYDPKLAEAYMNLGFTYQFRDKIDNEMQAYQTALELSASAIGMEAAIWLAVRYYQRWDLQQVQQMLDYAEPITAIQDEKSEQARIYHGYLHRLLSWHRQFNPSNKVPQNIDKLYVIGDSHSLATQGVIVHHEGRAWRCYAEWIMGCKQWHLANNEANRHKQNFESIMARLPSSSTILLTIGEIDCRPNEGILRAHKKYPNKSLLDIVQSTVEGYIKYVTGIAGRYGHRLIVCGVPASGNLSAALQPHERTQLAELIKLFNQVVKDCAVSAGMDFLDVYSLTNRGDGLADGKWHLDDIHLLPNATTEAFQKHCIHARPATSPVASQQMTIATANALRDQGKWDQAASSYLQLIAQANQPAEVWIGLARCQEELGNFAAARQALQKCLEHFPATPYAYYHLGWLCYREQRFEDALPHLARASELAPQWSDPYYHAAICYHELRRYQEAQNYYRQAVNLDPNNGLLWYHFAKALKDDGQLDAALPAYQKAIALSPNIPDIRYSLGLLHLSRGEWLAGWEGYELRLQGSSRSTHEHRPATTLPCWRGENVPPNSALVVYAEQGMGDSIQCLRYAKLLLSRFSRVKFSVQAPLVELFRKNAMPGVDVVARVSSPIDESGYTHHILMFSLPALFKTTPSTAPAAPYVQADAQRIAHWEARLSSDARPKVGLVWQGGKISDAKGRDMVFDHLQPLLAHTDVCWISLQKEMSSPSAFVGLQDWMGEVCDFADTAALVANLDLVVTVDTAVAHLAGALGIPVWLLNRYESEWRWMRGRSTTPWYSSMKIFNQPAPNDWSGVIAEIEGALVAQFALASQNKVSHMKTFLHIGCGPKRKDRTTRGFNTPEWNELRLDIDASVEPDIVASMLDMSPLTDAQVDAIFSSHNVEHLYPHEVPIAFKEFRRVLKDSGFAVITCPDLQPIGALIAQDKLDEPAYMSPAGPITPLDMLYGYRPAMAAGNLFMAHRTGFTLKTLGKALVEAGFATVSLQREEKGMNLWAIAFATKPDADTLRKIQNDMFPQRVAA